MATMKFVDAVEVALYETELRAVEEFIRGKCWSEGCYVTAWGVPPHHGHTGALVVTGPKAFLIVGDILKGANISLDEEG